MLVKYLFLFHVLAFSIKVQKELGSIFLTEGEYYEISLSDYFIGDNLSYEIADSNMTAGSIILENKCEIEMLSFLPYQNSSWNETWAHSTPKTFQLLDYYDSDDIFIWYNLQHIVLYNFSSTQEIDVLWNGFIYSEYQNPIIEDVKVYRNHEKNSSYYALILVKQQEKTLIWRNELYFIDLSNLQDLENPKWVNFSEITYASSIVLANGNFLNQNFIYCEFSSSPNGIFVYNVTDIYEPILNQIISSYYGLPFSKMSIVSMYTYSNYLYVLDLNFGTIKYTISFWNGNFLYEFEWNNLEYLGTLNSMWMSQYDYAAGIISSSGVLFYYPVTNGHYLKFLKGKGMNWENGCTQITPDYYFIQSSSGVLSFVLSQKEPLRILYNIDISGIVGNSFEAAGQLRFFAGTDIFYLRSDRDGLRVYKLYFEKWIMKAWGNSTYYAQIVAEDQNNDIVSSNLYVNSIPRDSQEIYQIDLYRPTVIQPFEMLGDRSNLTYFTIYLNQFFSGPNLDFAVVDLPKFNNISFYVTTMDKLKLYQNISLSSNITKFFIYDKFLVTFYNNKIIIDSDKGPVNIDISNPINILSNKGWIIYSKPNPNLFQITFYTYSNDVQDFSSEIDCLFFLSYLSNIICANSNQIDIYYLNSTSHSKLFSLTGEQFDKGLSWNITDLAIFSSANSGLYLYIIDEELGALVIALKNWSNQTEANDYYGRVSGVVKVVNTAKEICLIFENSIEIYDYPFRYKKIIFINIYEPVIDTYGIFNMVYLITSNALYIYDTNQPSHNSLFCMLTISSSSFLSFGFVYWGDIRIVNFNLDEHYAEIYTSPCPNNAASEDCNLKFMIDIEIGNSKYLRDYSLQTSISIAAFNKENLLKETFPISVIFNGIFPWFHYEKWEINKNIPYNQRYEIDLSKFFLGQNILMTLSVNGVYSYNETVENWPAVIPKRAELVGRYLFNNTDKASHIIIPNTETAVILASSEFIIFKAIGFSKEAVILNLTEISSLTDLNCDFLSVFPHTQYNLALLVTSCSYNILEEINYKNTSMYISQNVFTLIIWEFDYFNFEISKFYLLNTYENTNFINIAPLDTQSFEIMTFYANPGSTGYMNNVHRFRGKWKKNTMNLLQYEIINYFSLNLNYFCAFLMDFKVKDSETAYWYISDEAYGIRIIETSKDSPSILVGGLPLDSEYLSVNIGLCGDKFYLITTGEIKLMRSFKLKSYIELENDLYYSIYDSAQESYFNMIGLVVCSSDNRYIASPFWTNENDIIIRIWDTEAKNSSNIISEIYAFQQITITYQISLQFIGNSIISFFNIYFGEYRSYKINENYLIFSEMSESEYSNLIDSWGTKNFNLFIVAENGNGEVSSSLLYFNREIEDKKSENYWWVWLLVSIAIIGCLAGLLLLVRRLLKAHRRRSLEAVLMRELHHTEYSQDTEN